MPSRQKKPALDHLRSPHWQTVRKHHLEIDPHCMVCGSTVRLEVHHIHPFHLYPEVELVQANLITLCEQAGHSCHHMFGHCLDWHAWNPSVRRDAALWRDKIARRHAAARRAA
jgi:hypothetical protein